MLHKQRLQKSRKGSFRTVKELEDKAKLKISEHEEMLRIIGEDEFGDQSVEDW